MTRSGAKTDRFQRRKEGQAEPRDPFRIAEAPIASTAPLRR
jgi:hypothetical protein